MSRRPALTLLCVSLPLAAQEASRPSADVLEKGGVVLRVVSGSERECSLEIGRGPTGAPLAQLRLGVPGAASLTTRPSPRPQPVRLGVREATPPEMLEAELTLSGSASATRLDLRVSAHGVALRAKGQGAALRWTLVPGGKVGDAAGTPALPLALRVAPTEWLGVLGVDPLSAAPFTIAKTTEPAGAFTIAPGKDAGPDAWLVVQVATDPARLPFSPLATWVARPPTLEPDLPFVAGLCAPLVATDSAATPAVVCERAQKLGCRYLTVAHDDPDVAGWSTAARLRRLFLFVRGPADRLAALPNEEFERFERIGAVGLVAEACSNARLAAELAKRVADLGLLIGFHGGTVSPALAAASRNVVTEVADPWLEPLTTTSTPRPVPRRARALFVAGRLTILPSEATAGPDGEFEFVRRLPSSFERTRVLAFVPGAFAVVARKGGAKWYVAGLAGGSGGFAAVPGTELGTAPLACEILCEAPEPAPPQRIGPFLVEPQKLLGMPLRENGGAVWTTWTPTPAQELDPLPLFVGTAPSGIRTTPAPRGWYVRWQDLTTGGRWWIVERGGRYVGVTRDAQLLDLEVDTSQPQEYRITPCSVVGERGIPTQAEVPATRER